MFIPEKIPFSLRKLGPEYFNSVNNCYIQVLATGISSLLIVDLYSLNSHGSNHSKLGYGHVRKS